MSLNSNGRRKKPKSTQFTIRTYEYHDRVDHKITHNQSVIHTTFSINFRKIFF